MIPLQLASCPLFPRDAIIACAPTLDCAEISDSVLALMRSWKIIAALFLICSTAVAFESRLPFKTIFKGEPQFNRLMSLAKEHNWKELPIGQRTAAVGQALIGTRYTASPSNETKLSHAADGEASQYEDRT